MLNLNKKDDVHARCLFTKSKLSSSVSVEPTNKKKPLSTIRNKRFIHTARSPQYKTCKSEESADWSILQLEVLVPQAAAQALHDGLAPDSGALKYAKVHMKLRDVISGDFFNHYIKSGNIALLSTGRPGIDPLYSLSEGVLSLEIDKPTFERLGLPGKPIPHAGRKHVPFRYRVDLDLRLPAMLHGKPGFERVVRAFETVLTDTVTWLFCDLAGPNDGTGPIAVHQPVVRVCEPEVEEREGVRVPTALFAADFGGGEREEAMVGAEELLEWLGLAFHDSPRIREGDGMDSALSRYRVPDGLDGHGGEDGGVERQDLVRVRWRGLVTPRFALHVFATALRVSRTRWVAMAAMPFEGEAYTVLSAGEQCLTWEYKG